MHIGVIPDGNRRWAAQTSSSVEMAYDVGFSKVIEITLWLAELDFEHISFFALSHLNFTRRPSGQVQAFLTHVIDSMLEEVVTLKNAKLAVCFYGQLDDLTAENQGKLEQMETATHVLGSKSFNILLNYEPRWDATKHPGFRNTSKLPPCDLVFRSGGLPRLSGFLPLQSTNANLYFNNTLWPAITRDHLQAAIDHHRQHLPNWGA